MNDRILVTGGTGLLGRLVVERLSATGHGVRIMSRTAGSLEDGDRYEWSIADLRSGRGVLEAVADVGTIVHCATAFGRRSETRLVETLVDAAGRAAHPHLVYISIVGVDRVPLGYYRGKLAAERMIAASGLPYTIMRATQFHELLRSLLAGAARAPVMPIPDFRFQPIDAGEVADRLVELAAGDPAGRVADMAGPRIEHFRDLAEAFLRTTGRRRPLLPVRLPGKTFRAYREGGNLAPDRAVGTITFEEYLAAYPAPAGTLHRKGA